MKKVIYEIPFTLRQLKKIESEINSVFEDYLIKNPETRVSEVDKSHLLGQAKDQLTVFIHTLSGTNEKWSMSYKKLPIAVQTQKSKKKKDLMSALGPKVEERFIKDKSSWFTSENPDGLSYKDFVKEIYKEIYEGASTAGFYAIDSFVAVKEKYGK